MNDTVSKTPDELREAATELLNAEGNQELTEEQDNAMSLCAMQLRMEAVLTEIRDAVRALKPEPVEIPIPPPGTEELRQKLKALEYTNEKRRLRNEQYAAFLTEWCERFSGEVNGPRAEFVKAASAVLDDGWNTVENQTTEGDVNGY